MIKNPYKLFGSLAALFLLFFAFIELRKRKVSYCKIFIISISLIASFFIGARFLYGILYFERVIENPLILIELRLVNFALYGGLIFSLILWCIFCKVFKLDGIKLTDSIISYLGVSLALSKLGCFFNQCCYGKPTNMPWGVIFIKVDNNSIERMFGNNPFTNMLFGLETVHRHPTQLYEVFFGILAFVISTLLLKRRTRPGITTSVFVLIYSCGRLISFFFRDFPIATSPSNIIRGPIIYGTIIIICIVFISTLKESNGISTLFWVNSKR